MKNKLTTRGDNMTKDIKVETTTTLGDGFTSYSVHPPLGEHPEGNLDALDKLEKAKDKLFQSIDDLQENIRKLTEENKRLKDALGICESSPMDDLMEVLNGHK